MGEAETNEILRRIEALRGEMKRGGVDLYLAVSTDPHTSEYIDDHFKVTEFFSGCTSDNATLIVGQEFAGLWTDGRYFISAAAELMGSGISLMKMGEKGVMSPGEYLKSVLSKGMTLGFDGRSLLSCDGKKFRKICAESGASCDSSYAPEEKLWALRPPLPCHPVWILPKEYRGMEFSEKIALVRRKMEEYHAHSHVLSKLDDIMWLLNIRGADVECNPVALSYAMISPSTVDLFLQKGERTAAFDDYAKANRVKVHDYDDFFTYLGEYHFEGPVLVDENETSYATLSIIESKAEVILKPNPTKLLKARKNPVETEHIRKTYLKDSAEVCRFLIRMKKMVADGGVTETGAAHVMDGLRASLPEFLDLSFPTISAYGPNAAMAHYAASEESDAEVKREGFLLVDSGGQYMGGTTDVTRTMACGPLTEEMKRDYTLVAAANLRLMNAVFLKGTSGGQLDILAREVLYRHGLDYNHGTGHGIGYILNVHEGPQNISKSKTRANAEMEEGMLISDEPGVYKEGRYGIRIESILLVVKDKETEFGEFLRFEPLTFAPIDLEAIDLRFLEAPDIDRLNDYHRMVFEKVSPFLNDEEREALREATRRIG